MSRSRLITFDRLISIWTRRRQSLRESTPCREYCTHVEFRTLLKGVPDPPVDVQVELGPQDGRLLVTWLPVTINCQSGKSNGVPVTGYVVYADGRKVTEVDSPTGDSYHALLDMTSFMGLHAKHKVTVRTKTSESLSGDSDPLISSIKEERIG